MSLDPERALAGAILSRLRGAAVLQPLLGAAPRVHDEPPADPVHPFVTLGRTESRPFGGLAEAETDGEEGAEHVLTLTCVSRFGGSEEAKAVIGAIRALLHGAELTLEGHRLVNLRAAYADVFRASDWRSTYGVLRLRAVTQPI